jgi:hypothetical protein
LHWQCWCKNKKLSKKYIIGKEIKMANKEQGKGKDRDKKKKKKKEEKPKK